MSETTTQTDAQTDAGTMPAWHGAVVHTELGSTDTKATLDFLGAVFGMTFEVAPGPMEYHTSGGEGRPSTAVRPVMPEEPGPSQTPYVSVPDLDAAVQACTENGGTVMVPKQPVPGMGWFSWFQVPGGPVVAAWQSDEKAA